jgi:hypothetical protein
VPPLQVPKLEGVQVKVQVLKFAIVWVATGALDAPAHRESATVWPSDWVQVTMRVCTSEDEQVLVSLPQAPVVQLYDHPL